MSREIDLKKYLKNLMILESEKIRLDNIYLILQSFAKKNLKEVNKKKIIDYKKIESHRNDEKKNIKEKKLEMPMLPIRPQKQEIGGNPFILFTVGVIEVLLGIGLEFAFVSICGGIVAIFCLFGMYVQIGAERQYKNQLIEYERDLYNYNQKIKKYHKELQANESKRKKVIDEIDKKYDEEIKIKEKIYEDQCNKIETIRDENDKIMRSIKTNIANIERKLNKLYDLDIIFGKYRNFVAISTFYEYFITSRVFELEGKEGAYHLYEKEIKQKDIVTKIKELQSNLDKIKEKQYCIYEELLKNKTSVLEVENNINKIIEEIESTNYNSDTIKKYILNCENEIHKNEEQIKRT